MRLPDLNWPTTLYADAVSRPADTTGTTASSVLAPPDLWKAMADAWTGNSVPPAQAWNVAALASPARLSEMV